MVRQSTRQKRIYLDYAASTPIDPGVIEAMRPFFVEKFGNPGAIHFFGQEAQAAVDLSREKIAKAIGAPPAHGFREIIFTGSATEANNLAIRGISRGIRNKELGIRGEADNKKSIIHNSKFIIPRIIVSTIEHESILETARDLEREGIEVVYLPVDREGFVDLAKLKAALNEQTILVSIMYANNEIGTVQPISEIAEVIKQFKEQLLASRKDGVSLAQPLARPLDSHPRSPRSARNRARSGSETLFLEARSCSFYPLLHTDAVQALQYLDCDVNRLGVDLMTLSAHKIYGPKGIGALYVRNQESGIRNKEYGSKKSIIPSSQFLIPVVTGGGQEFGLRSGTENVQAIVGFAKAVELVLVNREKEAKRVAELMDYLWQEIKKNFPEAEINGPEGGSSPHEKTGSRDPARRSPLDSRPRSLVRFAHSNHARSASETLFLEASFRLPSVLNAYFPGHKSHDLLIKLDIAGIAVSSGSACSVRSTKPSHVLQAMGLSKERIEGSIRFSLGRFTTLQEIKEVVKRMREILG